MEHDLSTLGGRLRYLREGAGLSTRDLDALAGRGSGHTSMIETGRRANIERETAASLARVFGVPAGWLAFGEGPDPDPAAVRAAVEAARTAAAPQVAA